MSISGLSVPNAINLYSENANIAGTCTIDGSLIVNGSASIPSIDISGDLELDGHLTINNVESDSITTKGGLIVDGSAEIKTDLTVNGTLTTKVIDYQQKEIIESTEDCTGLNTGASQVRGGESVDKSLYVGYGVHALKTDDAINKNDNNSSLVVSGGVAVDKSIYCTAVNGNVNTNSISSPLNNLQITSTLTTATGNISAPSATLTGGTPSNDHLHGDLVVTGGIGCAQNINSFGNIKSSGQLQGLSLNVTNNGAFGTISTTGAINSNTDLSASSQPSFNGLHITNNDLTLLNGEPQLGRGINGVENTRIRLTPTTAGTTSYIKKNNNNITINSNGSDTNQDYSSSYPRTRLTVGDNLKVSSSLVGVSTVTDTMTIDNTSVQILQPTASTDVNTGALILPSGGLAVTTGNINCGGRISCLDLNTSSLVTLKSFGAVGDNVVDDTTAVQNFFNYLTNSASNKITGYINGGTYKITSDITIDFLNVQYTGRSIIGCGRLVSIFNMANSSKMIFLNSGGGASYNIYLSNWGVDGNVDNILVDFRNSYRNCYFDNLNFYNRSATSNAITCQMNSFISSCFQASEMNGAGAGSGICTFRIVNSVACTYSTLFLARYLVALQLGTASTGLFSGNTFQSLDLEYCATSLQLSSSVISNNSFFGNILNANNTNGLNSATAGTGNIFISPNLSQVKILNSVGCSVIGNPSATGTSTTSSLYTGNLNVGRTGQTLGITFNDVATSSPLNYYEVFSESKVWSSGNNTFSVALSYCRVGKQVTLTLVQGALVATANAPLTCANCVPARFLPYASIDQVIICTQNSNISQGRISISSVTGSISVWRDLSSNMPNNSALCVIGSSTVVNYMTV